MTAEQLLNKYSKIVDKIGTIGDNGGTNHDTHYYNHKGAEEDFYELEEIRHLKHDEEVNDDGVNDICKRLDKSLIVAKTIDKINKLEDIMEENRQYG